MFDDLKKEALKLGKAEWRPMLSYLAALHERSVHAPVPPMPYPFENIGPGYHNKGAFGHWDIVHQTLDTMPVALEHARHQVANLMALQQADGFMPGCVSTSSGTAKWHPTSSCPPVWPMAVRDYCALTGKTDLIEQCFEPLTRQIAWFEKQRVAKPAGFYYQDIINRSWESGVDQGVRFDTLPAGAQACIDATAHVYLLYDVAAEWAGLLSRPAGRYARARDALRAFIRDNLFDEETGFFHDAWAVRNPAQRHMAFEGMWPVVVGAATAEQARSVIDNNMLNPERFFSPHPMASVGIKDPAFELRLWRGPAWNSMTYWAARGCARYGQKGAARRLLEAALNATAMQFGLTGTIWEFYHPYGQAPTQLKRKGSPGRDFPCKDYLGHNPLFAMARLWTSCQH